MKRFLSLFLSIVIAVTAVVGAAPYVSASPDGTNIPVIFIMGQGTQILRENEAGEIEQVYPMQIPEGYIDEQAEIMLPVFAEAFFTQEWGEFCDVLYDCLAPILGQVALDKNGEASDGSYANFSWTKESLAAQADGHLSASEFLFCYDWRLSPLVTADTLHQYITDVMEVTGSDKVALYGRCLGSNVTAAYMHKYGDLGHVTDEIHYASSVYGAPECSKMFTGELHLNAEAIENFMYDIDLGLGETVTDLIRSLVTLMNYTYGTDILSWAVNNVVEDIYLDIFPRVLGETYGTLPGYWSMVALYDYDRAMETMFYGRDVNEYAGLIEKIEYYHDNVQVTFEDDIKEREEKGIEFSNIVKYGYQALPTTENANELSDATVTVHDSSFGAIAADTEETLSWDYLMKAKINGTDKYISPDKQIDASTCLSPDTTWFIKNLEHTYFPDCVNGLVSDIVNNKDFTIDSNPEYPQYLVFDDATQTISPMAEENMNTTERYETSFIDALFTFFKSIFALIIG